MIRIHSTRLNSPQNAFSQGLFKFGFNFFKILTVDLLHEFELGLWKDFSAHIVRILEFLGPDKVQTFNERYGMLPFIWYNPPDLYPH